ncbi:hypothetical protein D3C76_47860 [compost metagenome]
MNERELLELAAKAGGVEGWKVNNGMGTWNPLADDGEALRLAADLDLFGAPTYWHFLALARIKNNTNKYANVRLAIVRAAAEIGKAMP